MRDAVAAQVRAATPSASSWVSANAGSGKTRVLTDRVARLLLGGAGDMLPTYLESANPYLAEPAHDLLVRLRGADLGRAPGPWRAWIARLPAPARRRAA